MIEADKKEWSGILVYLECYKGELHTASEELIGEAVRLSEVSKDPVYVAGIGKDMDRIRKHWMVIRLQKHICMNQKTNMNHRYIRRSWRNA